MTQHDGNKQTDKPDEMIRPLADLRMLKVEIGEKRVIDVSINRLIFGRLF